MTHSDIAEVLKSNIALLVVALIGGLILFFHEAFQILNHNKLHIEKIGYRLLVGMVLLVALPALGAIVAAVYILNGDQLSPLLAFQIGLSSPAIVTGLMTTAANTFARGQVPTLPGQ